MKLLTKLAIAILVLAVIYGSSVLVFSKTTRVEAIEVKTDGIRYSTTFNKQVIQEVFGKDAKTAIKIAECESSLLNRARGDSGWSIGLFQIYTKVHTQYSAIQLSDPLYNTQVAYKIFQKKGWSPWSCSRKLGIK